MICRIFIVIIICIIIISISIINSFAALNFSLLVFVFENYEYWYSKNTCCFVCCCFLLLCNISQIVAGVPYSEYPQKTTQIASILINIGCNLTCFGPVQSFDVLILTKRKVGVACPEGALKTCKTHGGRMSLGALKHVKNGGGRMSVGCSQKLSVAHRPGLCYN
jgi:hypothetical protein